VSRCIPVFVAFLVSGVINTATAAAAAQTAQEEKKTFGASYADLSVEQRALVDDLFRRASAILGVTLDPDESYDKAPLSSRTTFDAVTHALLASTLTDRDSGRSLGRTFDLIGYVETIRGQVDGSTPDKQFRLYVELKPGARERLETAKEFNRVMDNTFFHEGYPLSYRQEGWPSIQISMARDASRADIDVDYRPGRFPSSLYNGHFSAANSDVRAGNLERHNGRWTGLVNWWDGLLRPMFVPDVNVPADAPQAFPPIPRAGSKTIDVAVEDFLTSWLVERRPNLSVAYFDRPAYDCLAARLAQEGQSLDRALAPLQMYVRMKAVADTLGPQQSLAGTTTGVRLVDPALKVVRHKRPDLYSIYGVPSAVAERWSCDRDIAFGAVPKTPTALTPREVYETFYSTATIGGSEFATADLGLLWQRRNGQWKIVSYQTTWADASGTKPIPDLRKPAATTSGSIASVAQPRITAEPALAQTAGRFLDAWLIRKQYDEALAIVSPEAYPCVNLYPDPGDVPKTTAAEQVQRLRLGLERVSTGLGRVTRLEGVIEKVDPVDPRMRVVDHSRSTVFGLLGVPDWMGPTLACEARLIRGDTAATENGVAQNYGKYFVVALRFVNTSGEGAVLALGWIRDEQGWRIHSFKIVES